MRILCLISSNGFFGAENVVMQLGREFDCHPNLRIIIGVIATNQMAKVEMVDICRQLGLNTVVFANNGKIDFQTIAVLRKYVANNGIDIIHSHGYKANVYSVLATLQSSASIIATCHNWIDNSFKNKLYKILDCLTIRWFNYVVAVSSEVKRTLVDYGINSNKLNVVRNGVNINTFADCKKDLSFKKDIGIDKQLLVIGIVGRLSEEKGHELLFRVFMKIVSVVPGICLLVIGDGHLRSKLQKRFDNKAIIFAGTRADLPRLYRCMDIYTLPSYQEGSPMVVLEAMAASLPVVATKVGEVPRMVEHKKTGLLISPGNERELELALLFLLHNRKERRGMGRRGYLRVKKYFSSEGMAKRYEKIYQEIGARGQ